MAKRKVPLATDPWASKPPITYPSVLLAQRFSGAFVPIPGQSLN